ncbi:MAG: XisI protein [Saprospiraceae bacterium]
MDKVAKYRDIIKTALKRHYWKSENTAEEYDDQLVMDDANGHYFIIGVGWQGSKRVHGISVHLDLKGEKIWIQQDYTERGIANDLIELGVPKSDIVLAFHAPARRQYLEEFAMA